MENGCPSGVGADRDEGARAGGEPHLGARIGADFTGGDVSYRPACVDGRRNLVLAMTFEARCGFSSTLPVRSTIPITTGLNWPRSQLPGRWPAQAAAELIRDRPQLVWTGEEVRVEVTDENQLLLFTVIIFGVDAAAAANLS